MDLARRRLVLGLAALSCSTSRSTLAADWWQFRGPFGQGRSGERGAPTKWSDEQNVIWKSSEAGPGTSSPIFVGDRILLTSFEGYGVSGGRGGDLERLERHVVCLSKQDGRRLWATKIPTKLPEQETIRDGHGYASNTPVSDGKQLFAFFGKSGVVALDLNGRQLWSADVGDGLNGWGSAASPVLYENLVIVNASVESESLVALDKRTGKEVWRADDIKESWNTPVLARTADGKTELIVAILGKVLGFDPQTGKQLWSCDTDIAWYMVPSIVVDSGVAYCIGGRSGGALAVKLGGRGDVTDSHRLWVGKKGSNVCSPVLHDGHLYFAHDSLGIFYCAEARSGRIVYEERLPRASQFYASLLLADGKIYCLTREGRTFVVAAKPQFELLATNDLHDRSIFNASPVVADGRLYLRSDKFLYCVGSKA